MPGDATPPPELPPGLLAEYLESARSQLGVLAGLAERLAAAGGDREALERMRHETHKVHGSAGSYGFMEASRLAAGMEATVKDWVARPDDADVERGSLARWFVKRLGELLGVAVPETSVPPPRPAPRPPTKAPQRPGAGWRWWRGARGRHFHSQQLRKPVDEPAGERAAFHIRFVRSGGPILHGCFHAGREA